MDIVFISGLKATSVIGCYDWERDIRQTLMIDLELKRFTRCETDALADALDYAAISTRVIAVCDESRFQLLEALAEHLATLLLAEFSIAGLRMTITKPGAVEAADAVGVVIEQPDATPGALTEGGADPLDLRRANRGSQIRPVKPSRATSVALTACAAVRAAW